MLRQPAVAGQFYPGTPSELRSAVEACTAPERGDRKRKARACLVPHAGYVYSGRVAGAVFRQLLLPKKILLLGVRHYPRGKELAVISEGAWHTPLGDVPVDSGLALRLLQACPGLCEDRVAHSREHSLEVQLPFLQVLAPGFSFVPVAVGTLLPKALEETGLGIAQVLEEIKEEILVVTSSDMNHYEEDASTRLKDRRAIDRMLELDTDGLYEVCRKEQISMCGLGPAMVMLTALRRLGVREAELVRYATSGDVYGERDAVVGYAGMVFH